MALPRLIHPVQVTIERFDQAAMVMDADAREPVHGARSQPGDTVVIPCQVHFDKFADPAAEIGGTTTTTSGYFLARAFDMDQIMGAGQRLKRGDRIVSYTSRGPTFEVVKCALYILRGDPIGHYPERGTTMFKYHVEDRDPVSDAR